MNDFYTIWPTKSRRVTSPFGPRTIGDKFHDGIDIGDASHSAPYDDEVVVTHDGVVAFIGPVSGYGSKTIIVDNVNPPYSTLYAHCKDVLVKQGQSIKIGTKLATMWKDGTEAVHLHYEVRNQKYNSSYFKASNGKFLSSIDPLSVMVDIDLSQIPLWGRHQWAWMYKEKLNDGLGWNNPATELQLAVFLKRYDDMKGGE